MSRHPALTYCVRWVKMVARAAQALMATSPLMMKRNQHLKSDRGFTLLEVLIVMGIMAGVVALVAPRMASLQTKSQSAVRRIAVLTRQLHTSARLRQQNYRLAFKTEEDGRTSYWVESGSLNAVPLSPETLERFSSMSDDEKATYTKRQTFSNDTSIIKKETALPPPIKLLNIETPTGDLPKINNVSYVYFFGQGLSQEVGIHLGDGKKLHWTLIVEPLTGKSHIINRNARLGEFK